ncbi:TetR/AcrR family transcriptional regulator [Actinomadura craniellae]|uniref:TetR/AcrR family transcriptional regulator n=1 Tax=Actinomadura craniellae TaxID=2231787 RepID=A0A365H7A3_9ACTN|nr:TetR/AcrR family transcriptional regulator [Actinomadura craniellae]RAY14882.1 TetR/AcrR family transcriptional regulator [Actinomadura craniellae]
MDTRTRILEVTARLLADSPVGDVSTQAVCEAARVDAADLYRHFGDKAGLLAAVVDHGFKEYLERKRSFVLSDDPVRDLVAGWDGHVTFALERPHLYRLMYSSAITTASVAAVETYRLLTSRLERCAAVGRLRVSPHVAAQRVMAANVGVALMLITRPGTFTDPGLSHAIRDAVYGEILLPEDAAEPAGEAIGPTAARLGELLRRHPPPSLSPAETALLQQWLTALSDDSGH